MCWEVTVRFWVGPGLYFKNSPYFQGIDYGEGIQSENRKKTGAVTKDRDNISWRLEKKDRPNSQINDHRIIKTNMSFKLHTYIQATQFTLAQMGKNSSLANEK